MDSTVGKRADRERVQTVNRSGVLWGGLRRRLRLPRGAWYRLVAVPVALCAALLGAGLPLIAGPFTAAPAEAEALAVAATAIPLRPHNLPGPVLSCGGACGVLYNPDVAAGDDVVTYDALPEDADFVQITYRLPIGQEATLLSRAHDQLATAGWRFDPTISAMPTTRYSRAVRDNRVITFVAWPEESTPAGTPLTLTFANDFTAAANAALGLGFAGGLLGGWLALAWTMQRHRRQSQAIRTAMTVVASVVILFATQVMLGTVSLVLHVPFDPDNSWSADDTRFLVTAPYFFPPVTISVAAAALLTIALAALPSPDPTGGDDGRGSSGAGVGQAEGGGEPDVDRP